MANCADNAHAAPAYPSHPRGGFPARLVVLGNREMVSGEVVRSGMHVWHTPFPTVEDGSRQSHILRSTLTISPLTI